VLPSFTASQLLPLGAPIRRGRRHLSSRARVRVNVAISGLPFSFKPQRRLSVGWLFNLRFQFHKRSQFFIRTHDKGLTVAPMGVCNPDRSPVK
jgi:hypothetical protein